MPRKNSETLTREILFSPAWDKRSTDPKKNYGVHSCEIRFLLKGTEGAVQFLIFTGWMTPEVQKEFDSKLQIHAVGLDRPMAADLGYHSLKPMYEGQTSMGKCEFLGGRECYYDGSSLNAEPLFEILLRKGSEGVWKEMEAYYQHTFGGFDAA